MMMVSVALIMQDPESLIASLQAANLPAGVTIRTANNGIKGLALVQRIHPYIVIIDSDLPDLYGCSLASIIKDSPRLEETVVYLINNPPDFLPANTKVNQIVPKSFSLDTLCYQITYELQRRLLFLNRPDELQKSIEQQNSMLPVPIYNYRFAAQLVYSPYNMLSGDGASFWLINNKLYGFLFDCVGHDLASYGQVGTLWAMLKKSMKLFSIKSLPNLAAVMMDVNEDLLECFAFECNMTPAICFYLNFDTNKLHYCSAGIGSFLYKKTEGTGYITEKLKSYLLGYDKKAEFEEKVLDLESIEEIIFLTDGFTELFKTNIDDGLIKSAKHDDVTALYISLKSSL